VSLSIIELVICTFADKNIIFTVKTWPTLQQRRTNAKMVMMYRIVHHHHMAIPSQMYLTPATTRTTRGHDQKFQISFS
jgi:hypothetical protein